MLKNAAEAWIAGGRHLQLGHLHDDYETYTLCERGWARFEPLATVALLELAADADVFVDVAAKNGYFALTLAANRPDLEVHALEADPERRAMLEDNVRRNRLYVRVSPQDGTRLDRLVGPSAVPRRVVAHVGAIAGRAKVFAGARKLIDADAPDFLVDATAPCGAAARERLLAAGYRFYHLTDLGLEEADEAAPCLRGDYRFPHVLATTRPRGAIAALSDRFQENYPRVALEDTRLYCGA